jgi:multidrug efflux system membrane fusion protein
MIARIEESLMSTSRCTVQIVLVILSSLLLTALVGCDKQEQAAAQSGAPRAAARAPVAVANVTQRDVPVQIKVIGNVEAYATVDVKTRVTGELQKELVGPGQDVTSGKLVLVIYPSC